MDPQVPRRAKQWLKVCEANGKGIDNWHEIYDGYVSACDFPTNLYYKELMEAFPDAKVILTVRDPHKWYTSAKETVVRHRETLTAFPFNIAGWLLNMHHLMKLVVNYSVVARWNMHRLSEEAAVKVFNE